MDLVRYRVKEVAVNVDKQEGKTKLMYIWGKCVECDGDIWVEPKHKDEPHLCLICSALRQGIDVEAILNA